MKAIIGVVSLANFNLHLNRSLRLKRQLTNSLVNNSITVLSVKLTYNDD